MDDLVERLRRIRCDGCYWPDAPPKAEELHPVCLEAADAIEQLQRQLAEEREACAKVAELWIDEVLATPFECDAYRAIAAAIRERTDQ